MTKEFNDRAGRSVWLMLLKEDYRRLSVDTRYNDAAASHYSWDNRVPNYRQVKVGDLVAIWDESALLGMSVIESIQEGHSTKLVARCPNCKTTNIESRSTMIPVYRCYSCKATFDNPENDFIEVQTFRSNHSQGWVDLAGTLDASKLRALCLKPKSQNSIRELRWHEFIAAIGGFDARDALTSIEVTAAQLRGGHAIRPVRVRLGQSSFRAHLLNKFGNVCAFSGPLPKAALEACHLYSYATVGQHDPHGGILLRRDLHRLFDEGLIAVSESGTIDVRDDVRKYPIYDSLHGCSFGITPTRQQQEWLQLHWIEFR